MAESWTQEERRELLLAHRDTERSNICEFNCDEYWNFLSARIENKTLEEVRDYWMGTQMFRRGIIHSPVYNVGAADPGGAAAADPGAGAADPVANAAAVDPVVDVAAVDPVVDAAAADPGANTAAADPVSSAAASDLGANSAASGAPDAVGNDDVGATDADVGDNP